MPLTIKEKIKKLIKEINKHDRLYFVLGNPIISDTEYDNLYLKLKQLEEEYPEYIFSNSPTQRVEVLDPKRGFFKRDQPMLSLDKCYSSEGLMQFISKVKKLTKSHNIDFIVQHKVDGVAFEIIYNEGILYKALTRGNGFFGEDITNKIENIQRLPKSITIDKYIEIRGELYITKSNFTKINEKKSTRGEIPFKNIRNTVAAILKMENNEFITFLDYVVYSVGKNGLKYLYDDELLQLLKNENLNVINSLCISSKDDILLSIFNKVLIHRDELDYDIDGLVYKITNKELQNFLGWNNKYYNYSIAWKFPSQAGETEIKEITCSTSKNGIIAPVGQLKELKLGSVSIRKVSLYNYNYIASIDLRVGDFVIIERSGDVIPKISRVLYDKRKGNIHKYVPPNRCPSCKTVLVKDGASLVCVNKLNCPAQLVHSIVHFVSKESFDIKNFSYQRIEQLVRNNILASIVDVFFIKDSKEKILNLKGWNIKSFNNLVENIERSKVIPLDKLINSLNIPTIGKIKSKQISFFITSNKVDLKKGNTLSNLLYAYTQEEVLNELTSLVGVKSVKSIKEFIGNIDNYSLVQTLIEITDIVYEREIQQTKENVVITGTFENYTRKEIISLLESKNYNVVNNISKNTSFLLKGNNPGSKLSKAQKLNVVILSEEEILKELNK